MTSLRLTSLAYVHLVTLKLIIFKLVTPEIHNQLILYKQSVESAMFTTTAERNLLKFSSFLVWYGGNVEPKCCQMLHTTTTSAYEHRAHKSLSEVYYRVN